MRQLQRILQRGGKKLLGGQEEVNRERTSCSIRYSLGAVCEASHLRWWLRTELLGSLHRERESIVEKMRKLTEDEFRTFCPRGGLTDFCAIKLGVYPLRKGWIKTVQSNKYDEGTIIECLKYCQEYYSSERQQKRAQGRLRKNEDLCFGRFMKMKKHERLEFLEKAIETLSLDEIQIISGNLNAKLRQCST